MLDPLVKFATALVPPGESSGPEAIYRWRVAVAVGIIGSLTMQAVHIAIACGWLAFMGLPGFVRAQDLDGVKTALDAAKLSQTQNIGEVKSRLVSIETNQRNNAVRSIDAAIRDDTARMCRAKTDDAKQYFTHRVHDELMDWAAETMQPYPQPSCDQLLTGSQ